VTHPACRRPGAAADEDTGGSGDSCRRPPVRDVAGIPRTIGRQPTLLSQYSRAPHPGRPWCIVEGVDTDREVIAIRIGGTEHLLTVTAGDAVHLTRETGPGETGQSAVPEQYLAPEHEQLAMPLCGYSQAALARPRWEAVTLDTCEAG
jgi:hypothetical protein